MNRLLQRLGFEPLYEVVAEHADTGRQLDHPAARTKVFWTYTRAALYAADMNTQARRPGVVVWRVLRRDWER